VPNGHGTILGTGPVGRLAATPVLGLGVQVGQIGKAARGEEGVANVTNRAFNPPLLVASGNRHGPGFEAIVARECQECRMKTDCLPLALEHRALQIIVEQDSRHAAPGIEGADVAAQKVLHSRIKEEAQVDVARVRKHHHKGHQRPAGATDLDMAKVSPVDLALLARQRTQPQVRLGCGSWPIQADQMPEVIRAALVSALARHGMQPAGREVGEFGQGLPDERQIRVDHRGAQLRPMPRQSSLRQHATHGRMMQVELARDGAAAPFLDVIQAQDPGLQFSGDGHEHAPWSVGWIEGRPATSHEVEPHERWQPAAAATAS